MTYALIKTGAALLALGAFAVAAPALAVSPLPLNGAPVLVPIQDEENAEVWHDLRPDITPPEAAVGKKEGAGEEGAGEEKPKEEGSGEAEEKALEEDGLGPE
jgi:hypothetical protein